ncbi:MAG: hypothetical protein ABIF18_04285 [archaeon]
MALRKIIKEKDKIVEKYSIKAPFQKSCKIPEGYKDIADAISSKLEDYCVFSEMERTPGCMGIIIGGHIPNEIWDGVIKTTDGGNIDLEIVQSYERPFGRLFEVEAKMKYANVISEEDLNIIRDAFTSSGLERIS